MIKLNDYLQRLNLLFNGFNDAEPWALTQAANTILREKINALGNEYTLSKDVAVHKTASVDPHAILIGPIVVSPNCFIGAHAFLRGGVFLDENVSIGPGCEVKSSFIFSGSALAHFNFVGDSVVGSHVNFEAGAIAANHFNERIDKSIFAYADGIRYATGVEKFGALIGDHSKIGANAVLSPGTILPRKTIVRRLELIEQDKQ
jgi:NDP-sugar pyrophosphorylase family protein